jgi:hypothetical protein
MINPEEPSFPTDAFPPAMAYILGAGRFGRLAAKRLRKRFAEASLVVVDQREDRLAGVQETSGILTVQQEILPFLTHTEFAPSDWIIPAVPLHVAYQWLLLKLNRTDPATPVPVPASVELQVPNPLRSPTGTLYASYATFVCPDACSEPDNICTHTKKPRPGNLYEDIARVTIPGFQVTVIRSWQLAPGVGGYTGANLEEALVNITTGEAEDRLVATSCRCHGVIDALRRGRRSL